MGQRGAERGGEGVKREKRGKKRSVVTPRVRRTEETQVGSKVTVLFFYVAPYHRFASGGKKGVKPAMQSFCPALLAGRVKLEYTVTAEALMTPQAPAYFWLLEFIAQG